MVRFVTAMCFGLAAASSPQAQSAADFLYGAGCKREQGADDAFDSQGEI